MDIRKFNHSVAGALKNKTHSSQKECPRYDTKLHPVVRLQFLTSGECGVPFRCHYSQVHSDSVL